MKDKDYDTEVKFTYMIEKSNGGYLWVFTGYHTGVKPKEESECLFFYNEGDLLEALEVYKKSSVFVIDDEDTEMMKEGERLSKKLNLYFQHP